MTGTTSSITNWNGNYFCPICNSDDGYIDSDLLGKNCKCRQCKAWMTKDTLLKYEEHLNFERYKKLSDILDE